MEQPNTKPMPATTEEIQQESKAEPSGYRGDNPSTAGPGSTAVNSGTPENKEGSLNPSAPAATGTTPGSTTP
ncbi:MAG: hypothetical protein ACRYF4_06445 [Janthinobacterium lividum]